MSEVDGLKLIEILHFVFVRLSHFGRERGDGKHSRHHARAARERLAQTREKLLVDPFVEIERHDVGFGDRDAKQVSAPKLNSPRDAGFEGAQASNKKKSEEHTP